MKDTQLRLSLANSVLSGDISAVAVVGASLSGLPITLQVLRDRIDTIEDLLVGEVLRSGDSHLAKLVNNVDA